MTLVGLVLDGRPGQYAASLFCNHCLGETIVGVEAAVSYQVKTETISHPFTIATEGASYE